MLPSARLREGLLSGSLCRVGLFLWREQAIKPIWQHDEGTSQMKVWIDQDLCTGDGLCEEIAPDVFTLLDDGLAYVKEGDKVFATAKGNPQGGEGLANFPDNRLEAVIESAEECPGECIFIEP